MSWNIRGLNSVAKGEDVRQVVQQHKPMAVCFQETKLTMLDDNIIISCLGQEYLGNYCFLLADGIRGGILLACKSRFLTLSQVHLTVNTISATISDNRLATLWTLTGVYGPQLRQEKRMFLQELRDIKNQAHESWVILGDFNLIYQDQDKSNGHHSLVKITHG